MYWEFRIPDNKNIGKLFSKHELLFLDQANSSSDPSQILIIQFPYLEHHCLPHDLCQILPYPILPILPILPSCFSSVSLFYPTPFYDTSPQVLDIPKHVPSQAN